MRRQNFQRENLAAAPCLSVVAISSSFMVVTCLLPDLAPPPCPLLQLLQAFPFAMLFTPHGTCHVVSCSEHIVTLHSINCKGAHRSPWRTGPVCSLSVLWGSQESPVRKGFSEVRRSPPLPTLCHGLGKAAGHSHRKGQVYGRLEKHRCHPGQ